MSILAHEQIHQPGSDLPRRSQTKFRLPPLCAAGRRIESLPRWICRHGDLLQAEMEHPRRRAPGDLQPTNCLVKLLHCGFPCIANSQLPAGSLAILIPLLLQKQVTCERQHRGWFLGWVASLTIKLEPRKMSALSQCVTQKCH